jgi:hypothetical protein
MVFRMSETAPRKRQQFIFVPTARQAEAIRALTAERRAVDEHVSQGSVIRDLIERGLDALQLWDEGDRGVYKLRAECWRDMRVLLRLIYADRVTIVPLGGGTADVEVTVENPSKQGETAHKTLSLEELKMLIHEWREWIADGDIMVETLRPVAEYTGERRR